MQQMRSQPTQDGAGIYYSKIHNINLMYMCFAMFDIMVIPTCEARQVGLVVSVFACQMVGHWFAPRPGHTKDHHKMVQTASLLGTHASG